jgi:hypothetical protein
MSECVKVYDTAGWGEDNAIEVDYGFSLKHKEVSCGGLGDTIAFRNLPEPGCWVMRFDDVKDFFIRAAKERGLEVEIRGEKK